MSLRDAIAKVIDSGLIIQGVDWEYFKSDDGYRDYELDADKPTSNRYNSAEELADHILKAEKVWVDAAN